MRSVELEGRIQLSKQSGRCAAELRKIALYVNVSRSVLLVAM